MIRVITASRLAPAAFREQSWLARSLRRSDIADVELCATLENRQGLPEIYNQAIDAAAEDDALVFVHDDAFIVHGEGLRKTVEEAFSAFDVVGVAGNRRRVPGQVYWISADGKKNDPPEYLSGSIAHPRGVYGVLGIEPYGPAPRPVKLLDGVLLAARAGTLQRARVRFDPRFSFHFYDLDFCRSCEAAGLLMGTWPILLAHASTGAYRGEAWEAARALYLEKWRD